MRKLTIRQIAELANVSPSTASRALRDHPNISEETKERVRRVVKQNQSLPIGLLIANPVGDLASDGFFSNVISGVSESLSGTGRHLIVETFDGTCTYGLPDVVDVHKISGLIVGGVPIHEEALDALRNCGLPVVFIGRYFERYQEVSAVIPDNRIGGQLVANHLVQTGCEEFVFFGGELGIYTFLDRYKGFVEGLASAGYQLPSDRIITVDMSQKGGISAADHLLSFLPTKRLGVFAATDWMAAGALKRLSQHAVKVPEQVAIVGFSDLDFANHMHPSLSSIRVEKDHLGYFAVRTLFDHIDRAIHGPVQVFLQPKLIVRESSHYERKEGCHEKLS